ncbi:YheU family protein [Shewanella maritima]|uniref:YheU family protein n=1 Tax=Shewanella maritima TaxID=2520507 RepID=UPI003736B237
MIVPFDALLNLPQETFEQMIKEHLITQVEDGGFDQASKAQLIQAIALCKQKLKSGELVVEFSEEDETIAIKAKDQLL